MTTKKRKLNFSLREKEILTRAITLHGRFLHGPESRDTTPARRRQILQDIADDVNALGGETRTRSGIQKKINDLRRVVRGKLAKISAHARGTGGGPACTIRLTAEERAVAQCFHRQQVEGLPGFDSIEEAVRTDVQEGAGPSGQSAASTGHESEEDPQTSQESSEEVEEEEDDEEEVTSGNEVLLHLEEAPPVAGSSQASIRGSPSHSSPNRASPPGVSPTPRPQASSGGRKATRKTRGWQRFCRKT